MKALVAARAKKGVTGKKVPGVKRVITLGETEETLARTSEGLTRARTPGSSDGEGFPRKDPPEPPTNLQII